MRPCAVFYGWAAFHPPWQFEQKQSRYPQGRTSVAREAHICHVSRKQKTDFPACDVGRSRIVAGAVWNISRVSLRSTPKSWTLALEMP